MSKRENVLTYKGYIGSVRYSAEGDIFHGRIEGIRDLITFEGRSVDELKKAFHEVVDDYLEFCKQANKKPEKSYKGSFNVRIDPEIHRQIAVMSAMAGISLNQFVQKALEKAVAGQLEGAEQKKKKNIGEERNGKRKKKKVRLIEP